MIYFYSYFLNFLVFILGASFASFISVYVERGNHKNFFTMKNKSACPDCLKELNLFELVPVFSYLILKGKCKYCKAKIPAKLFFGEVLLGVWFLGSILFFQNSLEIVLSMLFGSVFFLLALEDLENMEVSSTFIYLLVAVGLLNSILRFTYLQNIFDIFVPLLIISPFWIIYLINKNYIGAADPYVYTANALFFGIQFTISNFLYSVWFGAFFGIFYLAFINKKFEKGHRLPFLPIIFLSTLFILIFNYHIIKIQDILSAYDFFIAAK